MKKILLIASVTLNIILLTSIFIIWVKAENFFTGFIETRAERIRSQFDIHSNEPVKVVFLGDSITEGGYWNEIFPSVNIVNRGIGGDTTGNVLDRIDQVFKLKPEKIFLMIGVNDLNRKLGPNVAISNYIKLFDLIDKKLPTTDLYIQSVLPVNNLWKIIDNTYIPALNVTLKDQANQRGYTYIDLHSKFSNSNGELKYNLSNDGIHLLGTGYELWRKEIINHIK